MNGNIPLKKDPSNHDPDGYIRTKPHSKYMMHAMEYRPRFLVTISATSFFWTRPASSMVKPAAIHITRAPDINA